MFSQLNISYSLIFILVSVATIASATDAVCSYQATKCSGRATKDQANSLKSSFCTASGSGQPPSMTIGSQKYTVSGTPGYITLSGTTTTPPNTQEPSDALGDIISNCRGDKGNGFWADVGEVLCDIECGSTSSQIGGIISGNDPCITCVKDPLYYIGGTWTSDSGLVYDLSFCDTVAATTS
ncbi:hypothetical protein B7494_g7098 [Chlorociboria aeruginascens]|nr:hypothetical protein B7494_g7098 [Chlorociboria aeruginascens]